jgi:transposase
VEALSSFHRVIVEVEKELQQFDKQLEAAAPKVRPRGLGPLTFEQLSREVCDFNRFKNRKATGSYAGLVGGVCGTGQWSIDLPITKAGNGRIRALLVEAAWRWVVYQPQCPLIQRWKHILLNPKAHCRARKRAIIAVARMLLVQLWKWQTGRAKPEDFGWVMMGQEAKA